MAEALLFDVRRYSIHDGPGIRTVVFFKGCPLRCTWCHNPESQSPYAEVMLRPGRCMLCLACVESCPEDAIQFNGALMLDRALCTACGTCAPGCYADARQVVGRRWTLDEVMEVVQRDRAFYESSGGGVTFSGGEPLAQPEFLAAALQACKAAGLHTAVDTSGEAPWKVIEALLPWTDVFLYDLKLVDEARHRQATGVSNRRILSNLRRLSESHITLHLRLPLIPGINDDSEAIQAAVEFIRTLPHIERIDLLAFHNSAQAKYDGLGRSNPLVGLPSMPVERLQAIQSVFAAYQLPVFLGG
jgi:pyruvate formate lyase activating enzyme